VLKRTHVPLRRQQRGKREEDKRDREGKRSGAHFEIKGKREMKETHTLLRQIMLLRVGRGTWRPDGQTDRHTEQRRDSRKVKTESNINKKNCTLSKQLLRHKITRHRLVPPLKHAVPIHGYLQIHSYKHSFNCKTYLT
jgi:hypothetical protein